jgi:hypothetical protein
MQDALGTIYQHAIMLLDKAEAVDTHSIVDTHSVSHNIALLDTTTHKAKEWI